MRRRLCALLAPAVLLWGAAGCGSDDDAPAPGKGVDAGASVLRAEITSLLVGHAHLTGLAVLQARQAVAAPENAVAAEDALTQNAAALGDAVANARGTAAGADVVRTLRRYDDALLAAARAEIAGRPVPDGRIRATRAAAASAFARIAPGLRPRSSAAALAPGDDVRTAAGSSGIAGAIGTYAARMPDLGEQLAAAVVEADDENRFEGDPGGGAAELRSAFGTVLQDHVHQLALSALLAEAGAENGVRGARRAVDSTAVRLGDLVTSVYGQDAGGQVRALWRALQSAFGTYTRAKVAKQDGRAELALGTLEQTTGELADVLSGAIPTLRRADVLEQLQRHVAETTGAIRAITSGSPKLAGRVQAAAGQVLTPARTLAQAIQRDQPARFPTGD